MTVIKSSNLWFKYSGSREWAIREINMEVNEGEFVVLAGRSGCGKSTLLRCFNGLIPHFYEGEMIGKVEVCGLDTREYPTYILSQFAGMVFQNPDNQLFALTVEADIAFALENLSIPRDEIRERVDWALRVMGIEELRDRSSLELSGGQKQKVAIASILAMRPQILLLDEPTSSLDPFSAKQLMDTIISLNQKYKITILIAEHRLELLLSYASRIIVLDNGRVILDGRPREVLDKHDVMPYGVSVPRIVKVASQLKKTLGYPTDCGVPLSVEEFVESLRRWRNQ